MNENVTTVVNPHAQDLWQIFKNENLVSGDLPVSNKPSQLWYVRTMLGFAGWLGALFLMGFVFVGFEFVMDNSAAAFVLGGLFCLAAYGIFRIADDNDFGMQFGIAVSLAGQGMMCIGLFTELERSMEYLFLIAFVVELLLVTWMPNVIHRFLSTLGAILAFSLFLREHTVHDFMLAIISVGFVSIWLSDKIFIKRDFWIPIAYGFAFALFMFEIGRMTPIYSSHWDEHQIWWGNYAWWSGLIVQSMVWCGATYFILKRAGMICNQPQCYAAFAASLSICIASYFAPGIASAALILLIGFAVGNYVLFGIGILGLMGFLSHYYYQLQTTLLMKSLVLAIMGIGLLAIRWLVLRYLFSSNSGAIEQNQEEKNHA